MSAHKIQFKPVQVIILTLIVMISTIGLANTVVLMIKNRHYEDEKNVLGTEDTKNNQLVFWQDFLLKNPNYLPGWIELYKLQVKNNNYTEAIYSFGKIKTLAPNLNIEDLEDLLQKKQ